MYLVIEKKPISYSLDYCISKSKKTNIFNSINI